MRLPLSDLDLWLLRKIVEKSLKEEEVTTWDLTKGYDWGEDWSKFSISKKKKFLDGKDMTVNYRMKRMAGGGLVSIRREKSKNHYTLRGEKIDRIKCLKHTFIKEEGRRDTILVKGEDNKWSAFEI